MESGVAANGCIATDTRDGAYANLSGPCCDLRPGYYEHKRAWGISWRWPTGKSFMSQMQTNGCSLPPVGLFVVQ